MVNGKSKGSSFERQIAKYLTKWISGQEKEYYFWRSPSSGGIATINPDNKNLSGDLIPLKQEAKKICSIFSFELKTGYDKYSIDFHLKSNKSDNIKSFWEQSVNDATSSNKIPILIFKKKRNNPWICINNFLYNKLKKKLNELPMVHLYFPIINVDQKELFIFDMNNFLEVIKPNDLEKIKH